MGEYCGYYINCNQTNVCWLSSSELFNGVFSIHQHIPSSFGQERHLFSSNWAIMLFPILVWAFLYNYNIAHIKTGIPMITKHFVQFYHNILTISDSSWAFSPSCLTAYVCPWWSTHCLQDSGETHFPWCKTVPPVQKQPSVGVAIHDDSLCRVVDQSPGNACILPQSSTHPVQHASYSIAFGQCSAAQQNRRRS